MSLAVFMVMMLCGVLAPRVCGASATLACLWDYDTLQMEAKGLPGIAEILTGRIERNPPRYYEMRLERVEREIAADTSRLDLYDDAGVACDRIGRSDEAIEWMSKKREVLDGLDANREDVREHEYRYHANLGTFHAHRWLRAGARRDDLGDLKTGEREISLAIEINPEAHFGREKYQLAAIRWLMELPASNWGGQPTFLELVVDPDGSATEPEALRLNRAELDKAIEGIAGLLVLGDAWESVDVTWTLGMLLQARGDSSLAVLAKMRVKELMKNGRASFHPEFEVGRGMNSPLGHAGGPTDSASRDIESWYFRARENSRRWAANRETYMEARFRLGEHPDTHPEFWEGWDDSPLAPRLPGDVLDVRSWGFERWAVVLVGGSIVVGAIWIVRRRRNGTSEAESK
ncbi:MAG: hypothetical protein AB7Q00_14935 [Phycisphaerales bacterium]